jgi:hypothetical protein
MQVLMTTKKNALLGVAVLALLTSGVTAASARVPIGFRALAGASAGTDGFDLKLVNFGADGRFGEHVRLDALARADLSGFGLETAAIEFVGLPAALEIRMGLLRSRFGIENERHQSDSWFTDGPLTLVRGFGALGLEGLGLDLAVEIPVPWTLRFWGAMTEAGGRGQRSAYGEQALEIDGLADFAYQVGLENVWAIDDVRLHFDVHAVLAPNATGRSNGTDVYGAALGVVYRPENALGVAFETEWMLRRRQIIGDALTDFAGWAQAVVWVDEHWSVAARWDFTQGLEADDPLDPADLDDRYRARAQVQWSPTDGVAVRLQGTADAGGPHQDAAFSGLIYVEAGGSSRFFGGDDQ